MGEVVPLRQTPRPVARGGNNKGTRRKFGNVRKLPSGRYQASYTGPDKKRHNAPVTFQTKGDADTWLAMESAAITEHRWRPAPPPGPSPMTLDDYSARWLTERELKPRTRDQYRHLLDAKILPELGPRPIGELTAAEVKTWHMALDPAKKTTRAHAYALLRTILNTAVTDELIPANPCRIVGGSVTKRAKVIQPATLDELTALVANIPERYQALVMLAAWCALRFGELTELRRKDLNLTGGVVHVRRGVTWSTGDSKADPPVPSKPIIGLPKSDAGIRDVTIPPHLVPMLRNHIRDHAAPGPDGLIFPNTDGNHLHHGSLYKVFKPARKAAGREDLRFHDLRHTGAVLAAQSGATIAELMERLGHSTPGMALRYQHVATGRSAELARRLSKMAGHDG